MFAVLCCSVPCYAVSDPDHAVLMKAMLVLCLPGMLLLLTTISSLSAKSSSVCIQIVGACTDPCPISISFIEMWFATTHPTCVFRCQSFFPAVIKYAPCRNQQVNRLTQQPQSSLPVALATASRPPIIFSPPLHPAFARILPLQGLPQAALPHQQSAPAQTLLGCIPHQATARYPTKTPALHSCLIVTATLKGHTQHHKGLECLCI